jgi:hypothetical protein
MKKAQSMTEYVIVLTVIIAGIVLASGYIKNRVGQGMQGAAKSVVNILQEETPTQAKSESAAPGESSVAVVPAANTVNNIFTKVDPKSESITTDVGGNINMPTSAVNSLKETMDLMNPGTTKKEE